jgi:hypothetical protein
MDSGGLHQQGTNEEVKPVDAVPTETKVNDDINMKLKNMVAITGKRLGEFGHEQNRECKEESLRHFTNVTLRNKVRCLILWAFVLRNKVYFQDIS